MQDDIRHAKITTKFWFEKVNCKFHHEQFPDLGGGGGGTPLFGLYGDVPQDRVWFFGLAALNRV